MSWERVKKHFETAVVGILCLTGAGVGAVLLHTDIYASGLSGIGDPIGNISRRESRVRRKPGQTYIWSNVAEGEKLYDLDSVQTGPGATADIKLKDGTSLQLGENSLIVLTDMASLDLNTLRGSMIVRKKDGSDQKISVKDGKKLVEEIPVRLVNPVVNSQFFTRPGKKFPVSFQWVKLGKEQKNLNLQISTTKNFVPSATTSFPVKDQNRQVRLSGGDYYWRVLGNDPKLASVSPFRILEVEPLTLTWPSKNAKVEIPDKEGNVQFRWVSKNGDIPSTDRIQLASDSSFRVIKKEEEIEATSGSAVVGDIPEGKYFWRIKSRFGDIDLSSLIQPFRVEMTRTFTLALEDPDEDAELEYQPTLKFVWSVETLEPLKYNFNIRRQGQSEPFFNKNLERNTYEWPDTDKGKFEWRVTGKWKNRQVADSGWRKFEVFKGKQLALRAPEKNKELLYWKETPSVEFEWADDKMADHEGNRYLLQIARDQKFGEIVTSKPTKDTSMQLAELALAPGKYYWRVKITNKNQKTVKTSPSRVFSFGPHPKLAAPTIVTPVDKAVFDYMKSKDSPELSWKPVPEAQAYVVTVFHNKRDQAEKVLEKKITDNSIELNELGQGEYYWTVQAVDPIDRPGLRADNQRFKVSLGNLLRAPKIAARELNPDYIKWSQVDKAKKYEIMIYKAQNKHKEIKTAGSEWQAKLAPGHYTYKMRSVDEFSRPGIWGQERHLAITPETPDGVFPPDGATVRRRSQLTDLKFKWRKSSAFSRYNIEIEKDGKKFATKDTSTGSLVLKRLTEGEYRWRIKPTLAATREIASDTGRKSWSASPGEWMTFELTREKLEAPTDPYPDGQIFELAQRKVKLSWNKVEGAAGYEVRITRGAELLPESKRRFIVQGTELETPELQKGNIEWEVRAYAALSRGNLVDAGEVTRSTFDIKSNVFTDDSKGDGYLAFSTMIAPYQYEMINPSAGFAGSLESTSATFRLSGEYLLGNKFGLEAGFDMTMFSISSQSFSRVQGETALKYRLNLNQAKRPWVLQPKLGFGLREYVEFSPAAGGQGVQVDARPMAIGARAGFDLRKQFTDKLSLGLKFSYFFPLSLSGVGNAEITGDASFRNFSVGAQGVYWLGGNWGAAGGVFMENRSISYQAANAAAPQQIFIDGVYFFGSAIMTF